MMLNFKTFIKAAAVLVSGVFLFSCAQSSDSNEKDEKKSDRTIVNPTISESRSESLNYIFGTDQIADITLTITRKQWKTLLNYYDLNERNETCVKADFKMQKGDYEWKISDIGLRLRGNTSRIRPEKNGKYYQAHFKLDFEEWNDDDDPEIKLSNCIKGINLKRFKEDPACVREIYAYNYFRDCGVWTSPRAGYAHLFITIKENNGTETALDYGMYAMIEEINKQFLKARSGSSSSSFKNNKGNLWKCSNPASLSSSDTSTSSFGCEEINLDENLSKRYSHDLKTNKDELSSARTEFIKFINDLNSLSDSDTDSIKTFFESKMDTDLFIKTYAINVILGMDDDYWCNSNNYYIYFDSDGKTYFIPYDYDNILGTNCFADTATKNPLYWGDDSGKPLINKLLLVPEYKNKYISYLKKYSDDTSGFYYENSIKKINTWQSMIKDYINSPDLTYSDTTSSLSDDCASWCSNHGKYKLLSGDKSSNFFEAKANTINSLRGNILVINSTGYLGNSTSTTTVSFSAEDSETITDLMMSDSIYPLKNGYKFVKITTEDNGKGATVTTASSSNPIVYIYMEPYTDTEADAIPYTISDNKITFRFNPEDFETGSDNYTNVYLRGPKGWDTGDMISMTDDDGDGIYETSPIDLSSISNLRFKFYLNTSSGKWLGPNQYSTSKMNSLPEYFMYENKSDPNFIMNAHVE